MMPAPFALVLITASTPSATMLIGFVIVSGPKLPEERTLMAPLLLVCPCAKAKVRQGAVIGQVPPSLPVPDTQVSTAACAPVAPASRMQALAKMPIGNE